MADDNEKEPEPEETPESEQLRLMRHLVELAQYQSELSVLRTRMAAERSWMSAARSRMSADRTEMSLDRSRLSAGRSEMSADRSRMSLDRSGMSADRSEMSEHRSRMSEDRSEYSEHRSFLNAERTLSVWIRTALALMVAGIAVDKFALLLHSPAVPLAPGQTSPHTLSTMGGAALVAFGTAMALVCGIRYVLYARHWRRTHVHMPWHGPYLAFAFSLLTVAFGIALLVAMLMFI